ncbi:MAG: hypothetical protein AB2745_18185 [Candidatus Thiodiazotropha endolucinida]
MRKKDISTYNHLRNSLLSYDNKTNDLPGINSNKKLDVFIRQLIDSIRRIEYIYTIRSGDVNVRRTDPNDDIFDPIKSAIYFHRNNNINEAFWLAFLSIHFGKSLDSGWLLLRDIYGSFGNGPIWSWDRTSLNPNEFEQWLAEQYITSLNDGVTRKFGNHRKYESLRPDSARPTGRVIHSYINWIGNNHSHSDFIGYMKDEYGDNPRDLFEALYKSMKNVISFGRTARFDYLTMIAKLGLVDIEPGKTYMEGSTGPAKGARLLFYGNRQADVSIRELEDKAIHLENSITLGKLGMQVLEDALCNWQKSPSSYTLFRG